MNRRFTQTLAPRHTVNPKLVKSWIKQARVWIASGTATPKQLRLARVVLNKWGIG